MMDATVTNFDLLQIARILWQRKGLILLTGLAGAILALAFSTTVQKRYLAEGSVVVRAPALTAPDSDAAFSAGAVNEAVVTTEQEVLSAPGLLERAAAAVNIPPRLLERHSLAERAATWVQHAASYGGPNFHWVDAWIAELVPPQPQDALTEKWARLQFVQSALSVVASKNSSVINVRAVTPDAQLSADTVNEVLQIYMDDRAAEQNRTVRLIQTALTERLRQTKQQIAEGEARLTELMNRPGAIDNSEVPGEMRDIALVGAQLTQAQADLARRQSDYNSTAQLRGSRLSNAQDSGAISELRRILAERQANYARLSSDLGPSHPNVLALQRQITELQGQIGAEASRGIDQRRADVAAAQATVHALQQQLNQLRTQRQTATPQTLDLDQQKGSVASLWRISEMLETRLIDMAAHPANLNARVLSQAVVPSLAAFPNKSLYGIGGFVLASAATIILILVRSHIYRLRPVPLQLALRLNVPLLGGLPQVSGRRTQRRLVASAMHEATADVARDTLSSIAFEIEHVVRRGEMRCLMVASAKSGEGKTTVAVALGRSLAASGFRVLLVDLDLRRPSVEKVFQDSLKGTLHHGICELNDQTLMIRVDQASGIHLHTPHMAASEADPMRLLRSDNLHRIIDQVRSRYDLVLFDTPPLMILPDAMLIATMMDSILLVTQLGRSPEPEIEEFSRRLARTGKPICGVIVTKVKTADTYWEAY